MSAKSLEELDAEFAAFQIEMRGKLLTLKKELIDTLADVQRQQETFRALMNQQLEVVDAYKAALVMFLQAAGIAPPEEVKH